MIEILRDLARDQQAAGRVTQLMFAFTDAAAAFDGPLFEIVEPAMANLNGRVFGTAQGTPPQEIQDVLKYGLRVAAESMATDGASRRRLSDLAPEKRLPRLTVYYQLWRAWHVENGSGTIHA